MPVCLPGHLLKARGHTHSVNHGHDIWAALDMKIQFHCDRRYDLDIQSARRILGNALDKHYFESSVLLYVWSVKRCRDCRMYVVWMKHICDAR